MAKNGMRPVHPGEVLREEYLVPLGTSANALAKALNVPARLVMFPDENHWILKPQNSRLWYREYFAWLEKYVGKGPTKAKRG